MIDTWLQVYQANRSMVHLGLVALIVIGIILFWRKPERRKRIEKRVRIGDFVRSYIMYLPKDLSEKDELRVMIVFHPALGTGAFMERTTKLHQLPGSENFIVFYPDGFARTWNAGTCCGAAKAQGVDDLGFFDAMMDEAAKHAKIQPKAYVTGFSNGALLTYYLTCQRPDKIAAAAPFAAYLPPRDLKVRKPVAVPLLHLHGDEDKGAPVKGGMTNYLGELPPVSETIKAFAKRNGCDPVPRRIELPELDSTCLQYTGSSADAEAGLCIIPKLGHVWPGSEAGEGNFGPGRPDLKGSQVILEFFLSH